MTSKLTITDERVISVIERLEHYACNLKWTNVRGAQDLLTAADGLRELQERRKAAMDSEPVAWMHNNNDLGVPAITTNPKIGHYWTAEFKGVEPLYRHAQPAPVVLDDGKLRELFDAWFASDCSFDLSPEASEADNIAWRESYWYVWKRCRAAMLTAAPQSPGSEPATVPGKWIPVSERMPEDDDFVYIWPRPDFGVELHVGQYCECSPKGDGWYAQVYEQNYGIEWHPITVTHWMPLPAGPKETNS